MASEPLFYVGEDGLTVRQRPIEDDKGNSTMGFVVCTCDEFVDGAAEQVARGLNRLPEAEAHLVGAAQANRLLERIAASIRAGAEPQELADQIEEFDPAKRATEIEEWTVAG